MDKNDTINKIQEAGQELFSRESIEKMVDKIDKYVEYSEFDNGYHLLAKLITAGILKNKDFQESFDPPNSIDYKKRMAFIRKVKNVLSW